MPYLTIQTSKPINDQTAQTVLKKASRLVAQELGKPELYMMVRLEPAQPMMFGGSQEVSAFVELRGIGLPQAKTKELSRLLCQLVESDLGVRRDRVYINFADVSPKMWGWNGETF